MKMLQGSRGVSLTELLIVIAVLGILALIALPLVTGVPAAGKDTLARETMERLNRAVNGHRMAVGQLPSTAGAEAAVYSALTTRNEKIPGTPFFNSTQTLEVSADSQVYRFVWNGTYFVLVSPGTSGTGLALPDS